MISLSGYDITEQIYESENSLIYRAVSKVDNKPVIIKQLYGEFPSSEQQARFRREFEMTQKYSGTRIINAFKLEKYRNTLAIILEDFGAHSLSIHLSNTRPDIRASLALAIQMTKALEQVHVHHVIHKDINPSNFVWNADTDELKIIDFGISTELPRETTLVKKPEVLEGSLAYISPEQTGRTNKSIDYRTDLYSLGVTIYQLLTSQLPFDSDDPMETLHGHIAKSPRAPKFLNKTIPSTLSDIVMKLLSKSAEDRYQSASKLKSDLVNCLDQLNFRGSIEQFKIAQDDISEHFQIPQKLYGRFKELVQLRDTFRRVADSGKNEIQLITGDSGVGKSSLINEIQQTVIEAQGYFVSGKFEQFHRDAPYSSIIRAFKYLVQLILSERNEMVAATRDKLLSSLGINGQIIVNVIPELELIIGKQEPVHQLSPEQAKLRFEYTFQNFVQCLSGPEHPLVLFLDDLQWVDASSLRLLNIILREPNIEHMWVIGSFRDNEVSAGHPLRITFSDLESSINIHTIRLPSLTISHVTELISDTLSIEHNQRSNNLDLERPRHNPKLQNLANLCFRKTQGNPFFLNQFLAMLHRQNMITFSVNTGTWQWDLSQIEQMQATDNVVDLMISKIHKLPKKTQYLLSLAACIGTQFDLKTLSIINNQTLQQTARDLWEGLKEEAIEPVDRYYKYVGLFDGPSLDSEITSAAMNPSYRFIHDRIQQAAYKLIDEDRKCKTHWTVGTMMRDNFSDRDLNDRLFDIVKQLNLGKLHARSNLERKQLVALNLKAGLKAKKSTAYEDALHYLTQGLELLGDQGWKRNISLMLDLNTQACETAYLCGDFEQNECFAQTVLKNAPHVLDQAAVQEVRILSHIAQYRLKDANSIGVTTLNQLGIPISESPGNRDFALAFVKVRWLLRGKRHLQHINMKEMTDARQLASIRILSRIQSSSLLANPMLAVLAILRQLTLCQKYGHTPFSSYIYASYAMILCSIKNIDTGYKFGQLALELTDTLKLEQNRERTLFTVSVYVTHWKKHVRDTLPDLLKVYRLSLENGDPEFASYSIGWYCFSQQIVGKDLKSLLEQDLIPHAQTIEKLNIDSTTNSMGILSQFVSNLIGDCPNTCQLNGKFYNEEKMLPIHQEADDGFALYFLHLCKLILCYLTGNFEQAVINGDQCKLYMTRTTGMFVVPVAYFYHSLAQLAMHKKMPKNLQSQTIKQVRKDQKTLRLWSDHGPMNYQHKYLLVEAELARVLNKQDIAVELYKKSIKTASQNEYIQEEAIANELFAKFWVEKSDTDIAQIYMKNAHHLYQIWGATTKVIDLKKRYAHLLKREPAEALIQFKPQTQHTSTVTTKATPGILDINSVMKTALAISGEMELNALLQKIMTIVIQNAGARKALLVLKEDGTFKTVVQSSTDLVDTIQFESNELEDSDDLALSIVNYTIRTKETVVLSNAAKIGAFTQDEYIKKNQTKSALCVPIIRQTELTGILYLENNETSDVFTPQRMQVIQVIISQAAISVENAKLYSTLRQSEEKYRNILKNIEDGYFETDLGGHYSYVNLSFANMFGYRSEELTNVSFRKISSEKSANEMYAWSKKVYDTKTPLKAIAVESVRKDGSQFHCEISISLRYDSEHQPIGFRGILRDVSDRKKKEIEETKRKEAEISTRTKSEFLANMSHEIRTPMNAIIGFSSLALEDKSPAKHDGYFRKISSASESLLGIIDDVLDFSKMEAGKLTIEDKTFYLQNVLDEVSDMFSTRIMSHNVGLTLNRLIGVPQVLVGDPLRLKQILINLVGNAFKFTQTGQVELTIEDTSNQTDTNSDELADNKVLQFTVRDSGIGMTKAQIEKLFKPFSQVDSSTTREYGGTGLGLAISKQLVEMMGGQIWVESELDSGSSFTFTITYRTPTAEESENAIKLIHKQEQTERLELESIRGARVLLVEDDVINQEVACGLLESKGLKVDIAHNGREAIEHLNSEQSFDAVLMDIQMAEMDGYETTRVLRKDKKFDSLPIIAMTAHAMAEEKQTCADVGMNDHVSKPINSTRLFSALAKWIPDTNQQNRSTPNKALPNTSKTIKEDWEEAAFRSQLPGISIKSGIENIGGNIRLYRKILRQFSINYAAFPDTLSKAYHLRQYQQVKQLVHTLAGASGNIGAEIIYGMSRNILDLLKTNQFHEAGVPIEKLVSSVGELLDTIRQFGVNESQQKDVKSNETISKVALIGVLSKVETLITEARPEAEYLFDSVKHKLDSLGLSESSQVLSDKIEDFEYKEAKTELSLLVNKVKELGQHVDH